MTMFFFNSSAYTCDWRYSSSVRYWSALAWRLRNGIWRLNPTWYSGEELFSAFWIVPPNPVGSGHGTSIGITRELECRRNRSGVEPIEIELRQQSIASSLTGQFAVAEVESVLLYFHSILESICNALLYRQSLRLYLGGKMIRRHHWHLLKNWIIERTGDGVLHVEFLEFEVGAGHGEVLLARRQFTLGFQYIHLWNCLEGKLLARWCQESPLQRRLSVPHLLCIVGIHQVPVDVAYLGNGSDNLRPECDLANLLVGFGDAEIAQVRPGPNPASNCCWKMNWTVLE